MTVSALVLTLASDPAARAATICRLRADRRLTLGEPIADRLPLVSETAGCGDGADLVRELEATPGVARVDVIAIDFSEEP